MTTQANISHADAERISDATDRFEELVLNSGAARIFLIGAGCSYCAGLPLTMDLTSDVLAPIHRKGECASVLRG